MYKNYFLVYSWGPFKQSSCTCKLDSLWVHTRDPNPSSETIKMALDVVKRNALDETKLRMTNRKNC